MPREITEADWKLFRLLHALALERFCEQVLSDVARLTAEMSKRLVATQVGHEIEGSATRAAGLRQLLDVLWTTKTSSVG